LSRRFTTSHRKLAFGLKISAAFFGNLRQSGSSMVDNIRNGSIWKVELLWIAKFYAMQTLT